MLTIFDPIDVIFGTLKHKLRPYETATDVSFLRGAGIPREDCVQVEGLTLQRLKRAVKFGIPGSATALRDGVPLADNDLIEPGDVVEFVDHQSSHTMSSPTRKREKASEKPKWDDDARSLWVGDTLIKQFTKPSQNQELVLKSFQEMKWRKRIDDPLGPGKRAYTITRLNRNHVNPGIIRFVRDGTGKGIRWILVKE